jgi:hypothetical protein
MPRSSVRYSVDGVEGRATVSDVSMTGVRLAYPSHVLVPGTVTRLALRLVEGGDPIDVAIEVARETNTGFAGRFIDVGPSLATRLATELNRALASRSRLTADGR